MSPSKLINGGKRAKYSPAFKSLADTPTRHKSHCMDYAFMHAHKPKTYFKMKLTFFLCVYF